jgi:uncharacterized membrane protein YdjX (TVP38/TMEM64 family)
MNTGLLSLAIGFPILVAVIWVIIKLSDWQTREAVSDWLKEHWLGLAIVITILLFLLSWIVPPS